MKQRIDRARRTLNRALARYDRRADAYVSGDLHSLIWLRGASAMAMVKQARDLAGRLESMVYDGVGL